jgi:hypothetical protein
MSNHDRNGNNVSAINENENTTTTMSEHSVGNINYYYFNIVQILNAQYRGLSDEYEPFERQVAGHKLTLVMINKS